MLDRELEPLWKAGVRFIEDTVYGEDINIEGLRDAGFDAVFVGLGAWRTKPLHIPGSKALTDGLGFLRALRENGKKPRVTKSVVRDRRRPDGGRRGALRAPPRRHAR